MEETEEKAETGGRPTEKDLPTHFHRGRGSQPAPFPNILEDGDGGLRRFGGGLALDDAAMGAWLAETTDRDADAVSDVRRSNRSCTSR